MSKFYNEFIKDDFLQEKTASEVSSTIEGLSADILEKIAEEIDAISGDGDMTLEDKLAGECEDEEEDKEKCKEEDKEEKESSDCDKEEDKEEKESSDEKEEDKEEKESSDEKEEDKEEKESSDEEEGEKEEKESSDEEEDDKEAVKEAYELAEQKLASEGYTIADYVFSKCANEDVACFVADNAEKLAYLTDVSPLQVADNILDTVFDKIG